MGYCNCAAFDELVKTGIILWVGHRWVIETGEGRIYVNVCPSCGQPRVARSAAKKGIGDDAP